MALSSPTGPRRASTGVDTQADSVSAFLPILQSRSPTQVPWSLSTSTSAAASMRVTPPTRRRASTTWATCRSNSALTGSVSGTVMGQNDGAIADASIALLVVNPNYPTDEATWGVLGTARSDATGRFRLPYASPGSYVLAVDAPATSVYGGLRLPNVSVSTGAETQTGTLIVPHK